MEIEGRSSFTSFQEAKVFFDKYFREGFHPVKILDSKLDHGNEVLKYSKLQYACVHFGKPRVRNQGLRPKQKYFASGCPFQVKVFCVSFLNIVHIVIDSAEKGK